MRCTARYPSAPVGRGSLAPLAALAVGFGVGDGNTAEPAEGKVVVDFVSRSGSLRSPGDEKEREMPQSDRRLAITAVNLIKQASRPRRAGNPQTQSPPLSWCPFDCLSLFL